MADGTKGHYSEKVIQNSSEKKRLHSYCWQEKAAERSLAAAWIEIRP